MYLDNTAAAHLKWALYSTHKPSHPHPPDNKSLHFEAHSKPFPNLYKSSGYKFTIYLKD